MLAQGDLSSEGKNTCSTCVTMDSTEATVSIQPAHAAMPVVSDLVGNVEMSSERYWRGVGAWCGVGWSLGGGETEIPASGGRRRRAGVGLGVSGGGGG